ncbi:MAG: hypothetical protein HC850_00880 [Rhodomicrobium sp.]|nr:hypothetical protein [Rhodomicrobium sp.]
MRDATLDDNIFSFSDNHNEPLVTVFDNNSLFANIDPSQFKATANFSFDKSVQLPVWEPKPSDSFSWSDLTNASGKFEISSVAAPSDLFSTNTNDISTDPTNNISDQAADSLLRVKSDKDTFIVSEIALAQ